jgi:hypothetical protein
MAALKPDIPELRPETDFRTLSDMEAMLQSRQPLFHFSIPMNLSVRKELPDEPLVF